jgi:hypothetical protein
MKSAAVPVAMGSSPRVAMSASVFLVRDARVGKHVVIDVSALDLAMGLDFFAALLCLVVLLPVLVQPVMSCDGVAGDLSPGRVQLLDEMQMCLLAVLSLGVLLRTRRALFPVSHLPTLS